MKPWMQLALLKSAKNRDIVFIKSIGNSNTRQKQHTYFIKYMNLYNKLKIVHWGQITVDKHKFRANNEFI